LLFLGVGQVARLSDLHSIPAIHPLWLNVAFLFGRLPGLGVWYKLRLLNDNDNAGFIFIKESKRKVR
jgi:hypothetical protein